MTPVNSPEWIEGWESAQREIKAEALTPWGAQNYLDAVPATEGDDFDRGFRACMAAHAGQK